MSNKPKSIKLVSGCHHQNVLGYNDYGLRILKLS